MIRSRTYLLAFSSLLAACFLGGAIPARAVIAGDVNCCSDCGGCNDTRKVCRLVCDFQEVKVECWGTEFNDICLPSRSQRGCKNCESVCDCNANTDPDVIPTPCKKFTWFSWLPGKCSEPVTKKHLVRRWVIKKIPHYHWVVERVCPGCCNPNQCCPLPVGAYIDESNVPIGPGIPAPPSIDAPLLYGPLPDAPPVRAQGQIDG